MLPGTCTLVWLGRGLCRAWLWLAAFYSACRLHLCLFFQLAPALPAQTLTTAPPARTEQTLTTAPYSVHDGPLLLPQRFPAPHGTAFAATERRMGRLLPLLFLLPVSSGAAVLFSFSAWTLATSVALLTASVCHCCQLSATRLSQLKLCRAVNLLTTWPLRF